MTRSTANTVNKIMSSWFWKYVKNMRPKNIYRKISSNNISTLTLMTIELQGTAYDEHVVLFAQVERGQRLAAQHIANAQQQQTQPGLNGRRRRRPSLRRTDHPLQVAHSHWRREALRPHGARLRAPLRSWWRRWQQQRTIIAWSRALATLDRYRTHHAPVGQEEALRARLHRDLPHRGTGRRRSHSNRGKFSPHKVKAEKLNNNL